MHLKNISNYLNCLNNLNNNKYVYKKLQIFKKMKALLYLVKIIMIFALICKTLLDVFFFI